MKAAHWSDTAEGKSAAVEMVIQQHGRRPAPKQIAATAALMAISATDLAAWVNDAKYAPESSRTGGGMGETAADEEAMLTAMAAQSSGLPVEALATASPTPLAILLASEDDGLTEDARVEVLKKLLAFLTQGTSGISVRWKRTRTSKKWAPGMSHRTIPMPNGIEGHGKIGKQLLVFELDGDVIEVIPFARVHTVKPKHVAISILRPSHQLSEKMIARDIALLQDYLNGSKLNGQEIADICGETRANVSVRRRNLDQRIRDGTGGKSGMPGLRHRPDPRRGIKTGPRKPPTTES